MGITCNNFVVTYVSLFVLKVSSGAECVDTILQLTKNVPPTLL